MTRVSAPLFSVRVAVPGSSANVGAGFDALGVAVRLFDEWTVQGFPRGAAPALAIEAGGLEIPRDARNLAYRAFRRVYALAKRPLPALRFVLRSGLPVAGGLGSSSAAIVGGLVAANVSLGRPFATDRLLNEAAAFEGHPDNVAPALYGGLCAAVITPRGVRCAVWRNPATFRGLSAVVGIPRFELKTKKARGVLPARVPHADAVFNVGRAVLLIGALVNRRFDLIGDAMADRLHEPYRKRLVPGFEAVTAGARRAGAFGAALSGAGPTILALAPPAKARAVGAAMTRAFARAGVPSVSRVLSITTDGARVLGAAGRARR